MTSPILYSMYKRARAEVAETRAEYEAECAADRARGHRPHYCIHGTSQWVDYDNICSGCESGDTDLQVAVYRAQNWFRVYTHKKEQAQEVLDLALKVAASTNAHDPVYTHLMAAANEAYADLAQYVTAHTR